MISIKNIELNNLGTVNKNLVTFELDGGNRLRLWFSYKTLIAFEYNGQLSCRNNEWGPTTGKLLNLIESDKSKRIDKNEFNERLERIKLITIFL